MPEKDISKGHTTIVTEDFHPLALFGFRKVMGNISMSSPESPAIPLSELQRYH